MGKISRRLWFDRLISGSSARQIGVLLIATLGIFFLVGGLMVMAFGTNIGHTGTVDKSEHFWQLYYFFADPGNQMTMDGRADGSRIIGLIMSSLGSIFLGGLLISTITNTIQLRVEKFKKGRNYYNLKDHVAIIGSDQMLQGIINQLCTSDVKHIVVMTSGDVEEMRSTILSILSNKKNRKKIIVNYGQRYSEDHLNKINITKAREVYILGDKVEFDDIESFHDSLNIQCLHLIAKLCKNAGRKGLPCNVAFDYKTTYHVFQYSDLQHDITDYINFQPFNFFDFWAQKVMVYNFSQNDNVLYSPLDYRNITSPNQEEYVHLIVIGMSKMGQAMARQCSHIAHFPNWRKRKTRITIIDRNMRQGMDEFKQKCGELFQVSHSEYIDADKWRETGVKESEHYHINKTEYSHLSTNPVDPDFIDIEWTFINGDDSNPFVRKLLEEYASDKNAIVTVAVCLNITHKALRSAMFLPKIYYEKEIPVLVQQRKTSSIVDTLNGKTLKDEKRLNLLYRNIKPFGMVYDCYDIRFAMEVRYCKRINAVYSFFFEYGIPPVNIDNETADRLWSMLPTSKRWSNIFSAASIPTKLRCIGYSIDDLRNNKVHISDLTDNQIKTLSEMEHNRWNVEELLLGYRPVHLDEDIEIDNDKSKKSVYKKRHIHYDIRPYDGLKIDESGRKADVYDEMIIRSLPVIVNT